MGRIIQSGGGNILTQDSEMKRGAQSPDQLRKRRTLIITCLLVFGLTAVAIVSAAQDLKLPDDLKSWIDMVQSLLTTLGLLIGGLWVLYIFVLGRSYMAHVQIQVDLKYVPDLVGDRGVVVSVKLKNIGRTRVRKAVCAMSMMLLSDQRLNLLKPRPEFVAHRPEAALKLINTSLNRQEGFPSKEHPIFHRLVGLEPDEEATEDFIFFLGETSIVKVDVIFTGTVFASSGPLFRGRRRTWGAHTILDTRAINDEPDTSTKN